MNIKKLLMAFFLMIPGITWAQSEASETVGYFEQYQLEIVLGLVVVVCLVALLVLFVALYTIQSLVRLDKESKGEVAQEDSAFAGIWNSINDFKSEEEEEALLTDHEYDGIKELDNDLPPWWLWGFYFTIAFGVVYLMAYHVFQWAPLQDEEYKNEMAAAKIEVEKFLATQENLVDETNVELLLADADLTSGKNMYDANCVACHGSEGQGGVGPNLTDKYWKHGGDIKDIFKSIKYGIPEKGMISWQNQFNPKKIQQIASYIYTMEGTNPSNPKDPEGELFERESGSEESDTTAVVEEQVSLLQ